MVHKDVQWLATVRGRLGYTWGSSMVYATGGGAWENLRTRL
jgi:outer membrane immunogenic protein